MTFRRQMGEEFVSAIYKRFTGLQLWEAALHAAPMHGFSQAPWWKLWFK